MNLKELITTRRSIRKFTNQSVSEELIKQIIEAGHWAPSNCNTQGWKFIVVSDKKLQQEIVDQGGSLIITQAPIGILALYEETSENPEYQDSIQAGAAALQNMFLMAHALGLGACWLCHLPRKKDLKKIFKISKNYAPIAYLMLGYSASQPGQMPRQEKLEEIISYNIFKSNWDQKDFRRAKIKTKRLLKKIYFALPKVIKKIINPLIDKKFVRKFKN